jgi:hypothetical protein
LAVCRGHHFQTTPYLKKTGLYWELMITHDVYLMDAPFRGYGNPKGLGDAAKWRGKHRTTTGHLNSSTEPNHPKLSLFNSI